MENVVKGMIYLIAVPLLILNVFGGIVSGIILLIGGDWVPVLFGVLFLLFGTLLISLLLLPSLLFGGLGIYFANRKNRVGTGISVFASQWWIYAVMFGVCYSVFGTMLQFDDQASRLVLLIWAFSVAVAPWTYMAGKEQNNDSTQLTLFLSQTGLLVILIMIAFFNVSVEDSFRIISTLTIFPVLFTTAYTIKMIHNSGEFLLTDSYGAGNSKYSQKELIAFFVALLHVAKSDNHLHVEEIKEVRSSFKNLTGERIGKGFVERIYLALDSGFISLEDSITEISESTNHEFKKLIIQGCRSVAHADKKLHDEEIAAIKHIGHLLDLNNTEILKILNEK